MDIIIKDTFEILENEWMSYVSSFNKVFKKEFDIQYFKDKYFQTIDNCSYHVFLKHDDIIVGACSVIPYNYLYNNVSNKIGLAVDVFIVEEYRTDPLGLYRMYKKLKKTLIQKNIDFVIAVPNDVAYPYWKNVVKWKDIGQLEYYSFPVKIGNVINKLPLLLNPINIVGYKVLLLISRLFNTNENLLPIRIDRSNKIIEKQRYHKEHNQVEINNLYFSYRIVNEDGVLTCYIIDFYNKKSGKKDNKSLRNAIDFIIKNEKVDILIYVGKLQFKQLLLFKLPKKFEPKHLYFTIDVFSDNYISHELIYNIKNWDFGLFNYDVR